MTNAEARFNKIHIRKVYACLAGGGTDTETEGGGNGYRNKSQHRKSTLENKILPPFQQGFEPETFQSRVRCSNHRAIPAPLAPVFPRFPDRYQFIASVPNAEPSLRLKSSRS